jgi:hypothetical protein
MPSRYQVISANNIGELEERANILVEQGYTPIGAIQCGTKQVTVAHNIKGATTHHEYVLRQAFWHTQTADSASQLAEQVTLLQEVVNHTHEVFSDDDKTVEIDRDIVEAIDAYLRGEA